MTFSGHIVSDFVTGSKTWYNDWPSASAASNVWNTINFVDTCLVGIGGSFIGGYNIIFIIYWGDISTNEWSANAHKNNWKKRINISHATVCLWCPASLMCIVPVIREAMEEILPQLSHTWRDVMKWVRVPFNSIRTISRKKKATNDHKTLSAKSLQRISSIACLEVFWIHPDISVLNHESGLSLTWHLNETQRVLIP